MDGLFENARLFQTLIENLEEGVYVTDTERRIQYWNKGAEKIAGFSPDEVLGRCCSDDILMHTDDMGRTLCRGFCPLAATMQDRTQRNAKVYLHHKQGHRVPVMVATLPIYDDAESVTGGMEIFHEATEIMSALAQIEELRAQSLICSLTGIGNRRYADQMLKQKFDEMERNKTTLGLLFIDIDHFKPVNDRYGHHVGDIILKMVARTLANAMRTYDFLARWGGEEFIILLPNMHRSQLKQFAERLRTLVLQSSVKISKGSLAVSISIGATVVVPGDSIENSLKRVDTLLYQSKEQGRNRVTIG